MDYSQFSISSCRLNGDLGVIPSICDLQILLFKLEIRSEQKCKIFIIRTPLAENIRNTSNSTQMETDKIVRLVVSCPVPSCTYSMLASARSIIMSLSFSAHHLPNSSVLFFLLFFQRCGEHTESSVTILCPGERLEFCLLHSNRTCLASAGKALACVLL